MFPAALVTFNVLNFKVLERSAFTDIDNISNLKIPETRTLVHEHVLVAFLESVVLFDVVQVISPDNHGPEKLEKKHW